MRYALALAWLAVLGVCVAAAPPYPPTHEATVFLRVGPGSCSGTAVGPNVVLTATHCAANGLWLIDGLPVQVLSRKDDGNDHTLLRVSRTFPKWAKVGKNPPQKAEVHWYGNPFPLRDMYRAGYVAGRWNGMILIDAPCAGGDSGSGIFDARGRLVGVLSGEWNNRDMALTALFPLAFSVEDWEAASK